MAEDPFPPAYLEAYQAGAILGKMELFRKNN